MTSRGAHGVDRVSAHGAIDFLFNPSRHGILVREQNTVRGIALERNRTGQADHSCVSIEKMKSAIAEHAAKSTPKVKNGVDNPGGTSGDQSTAVFSSGKGNR
jgi:hypothetical protein